jgi:phosphogluconate dehydratase
LRVALLTDGRLSGASGKVLSALHVTPEALAGGPIARLRDGDPITIDSVTGALDIAVDEQEWEARLPSLSNRASTPLGLGRDLFAGFRAEVGAADLGASVFWG